VVQRVPGDLFDTTTRRAEAEAGMSAYTTIDTAIAAR